VEHYLLSHWAYNVVTGACFQLCVFALSPYFLLLFSYDGDFTEMYFVRFHKEVAQGLSFVMLHLET
jgi:hypothetical protein